MTDDTPKLTKREWDALGTLLLPISFGGKTTLGPKMAVKLAAFGLIAPFSEVVQPRQDDPPWLKSIRIRHTGGYQLTPRGQLLYCQWADKQETKAERSQNDHKAAEPSNKLSKSLE